MELQTYEKIFSNTPKTARQLYLEKLEQFHLLVDFLRYETDILHISWLQSEINHIKNDLLYLMSLAPKTIITFDTLVCESKINYEKQQI